MEINRVLRWGILTGLFAIPFIPILVAEQSFFPFITGKNFAFRIIVEVVLALWVVLALRDPSSRPKKSFIAWTVLALLAVAGVATIFSLNPYRSFWSNYERMGGYLSLLHVGAYFLVLTATMRSRALWFWLANISLLANVYVVLYGFAQLLGRAQIHQSASRLDASLGNSAYLAVYALFHVFIAGYLAWTQWQKNRALAYLYGLVAIANAVVLYYTATRGAILGLLGGILVAFVLTAVLASGRTRKISAIVVGLILALMVGFVAVKDTTWVRQNQVLSRLASISLNDGTTKSRFMIWQMSLAGFKERPILGWGPENYSLVFAKYYNPAMWSQEPWFDRSHNIFLDWLIDAGILGLIAYLSIFATAFWYLWRERRRFGVGAGLLVGLLAGYLFQNIFVFDNLISYIYFFALIAFIHFVVTKDDQVTPTDKALKVKKDYRQTKMANNNETKELLKLLAMAVVTVSAFGSLYYFNYRPYTVSAELIQAFRSDSVNPTESLTIWQKIFARQTFGSGEAFEQFLNFASRHLNDPQTSAETKSAYRRLAEEEFATQLKHSAEDARFNLLAGSYLTMTDRLDDGIILLETARQLSPRKQQILIELGVAYVRQQNATKALTVIKEAYDLDPTYPEARKMYALLSLLTNQRDLAIEILAPIKNDPTYYLDDRFLAVYREADDQVLLQEMMALRDAAKK